MPDQCRIDQITVKEPEKDAIRQCIQCRKCAKGEGSTVECNAVITPDTLVGCEKCKPGQSFSSEDGTGICEPCDDCDKRGRVTVKECTPTSNGVCGGCKPGRYEDRLTSQCEPCSACCGDNRDIKEEECEAQGLAADKVCNAHRVCPKNTTSITTTSPSRSSGRKRSQTTVPTPKGTPTPSRVHFTPPSVRPSQQMSSFAPTSVIGNSSKAMAGSGHQSSGLSSSNTMAFSVGVPLVLVIVLGLAVYRFKQKKRRSCCGRAEPAPVLEVGLSESAKLVGVPPTVDGENEEGKGPIQDTKGPGHFLPDWPLRKLMKHPSWGSHMDQAIVKAGGADAARRRFETSVGRVPIKHGAHAVRGVFVEAVIKGYPTISGTRFLEVVSGGPIISESGTVRETAL